MATNNFWLLRAVTNLHAGSGDSDYGIIDKQVQRDPVTFLPSINASSIKGAFREQLDGKIPDVDLRKIFGSDNRKGKNENLEQGHFRFFSAKLLALPVRSDHDFYYLATCPEILTDFLKDADLFGIDLPEELKTKILELSKLSIQEDQPIFWGGSSKIIRLEDWNSSQQTGKSGLEALLSIDRIAMLHASNFQTLCKELPVIARNHLENGISTNLWYEEIVPRETRFYFPVIGPDNSFRGSVKTHLKDQIQVGANATVGYGVCKLITL